jgi:hypothetical protein
VGAFPTVLLQKNIFIFVYNETLENLILLKKYARYFVKEESTYQLILAANTKWRLAFNCMPLHSIRIRVPRRSIYTRYGRRQPQLCGDGRALPIRRLR